MKDTDTGRGVPSPDNPQFADMHSSFDRMADRLDQERFPGQAWSPAVASPRPSRLWPKIAISLLATAAALFLAIHFWPVAKPPAVPPANTAPLTATASLPRIIIIEDLDSYSIIDLSAASPVISFESKDPMGPPPAIAVLTSPSRQPSTMNSHL